MRTALEAVGSTSCAMRSPCLRSPLQAPPRCPLFLSAPLGVHPRGCTPVQLACSARALLLRQLLPPPARGASMTWTVLALAASASCTPGLPTPRPLFLPASLLAFALLRWGHPLPARPTLLWVGLRPPLGTVFSLFLSSFGAGKPLLLLAFLQLVNPPPRVLPSPVPGSAFCSRSSCRSCCQPSQNLAILLLTSSLLLAPCGGLPASFLLRCNPPLLLLGLASSSQCAPPDWNPKHPSLCPDVIPKSQCSGEALLVSSVLTLETRGCLRPGLGDFEGGAPNFPVGPLAFRETIK